MKNFRKGPFTKGDSRGNDGFRGGNRRPFGGDRDAERRPFGNKSWGRDGGKGFNPQMHPATCAQCGKPCQVPFRPAKGKDVFCNECFGKDGARGGSSFDRNDRNDRKPFVQKDAGSNRQGEDMKKHLESLHGKLDQILSMLSSSKSEPKPEPKEAAVKKAPKPAAAKTVKAKPKAKAVKKKKA